MTESGWFQTYTRRAGVVLAVCPVLMLSAASPSWAFDDLRTGLVVGCSIGPGVWYDLDMSPGSNVGLFSDVSLGYGMKERIVMYVPIRLFVREIPNDYVLMQLAIGSRYYARKLSPSIFGIAELGFTAEFAAEHDHGTGHRLCVTAGVGYEWTRHWSLQLAVTYNTGPKNVDVAMLVGLLLY